MQPKTQTIPITTNVFRRLGVVWSAAAGGMCFEKLLNRLLDTNIDIPLVRQFGGVPPSPRPGIHTQVRRAPLLYVPGID